MHNESCRCRVCGYLLDFPPWGDDGHTASFEICPCCGVEFGYEDSTKDSAKKYRQAWISKGASWFEPQKQPSNWNLDQQLDAIRRSEEEVS